MSFMYIAKPLLVKTQAQAPSGAIDKGRDCGCPILLHRDDSSSSADSRAAIGPGVCELESARHLQ